MAKEEEDREAQLEESSNQEIFSNHHDSPERISAIDFPTQDQEEEDSDENSDDEFEFQSVIRDPSVAVHHPIYPVFGRSIISPPETPELDSPVRLPLRKLLVEERNSSIGSTSSSSSMAETVELEGIPTDSYCVWTPASAPQSPARCHKSGSTGSLVKWKKISDLVLGRSQSDGKEKFVFLSAKGNAKEEKKVKEKEKGKKKGKGGKVTTEVDTITAHRIFYGNKSGARNGVAGGRKSFLPYKQDLVGLFASVNGISRSHHPF
ncbi:hypothetical protein LUZ62_064993 [Rhynchospora pubera]|uniref:Uncharacterized protein n=1 Tax=Rhynchospora pubera TaxID=906938 RepID=A0AAV8EPK1_9POAL|nr:hypothetical protein LUZ62_064993 [Rhynchospora pubera]